MAEAASRSRNSTPVNTERRSAPLRAAEGETYGWFAPPRDALEFLSADPGVLARCWVLVGPGMHLVIDAIQQPRRLRHVGGPGAPGARAGGVVARHGLASRYAE